MAPRKHQLIGLASLVLGLFMVLPGHAQRIRSELRPDWSMGMQVIGYSDRLSVQQGETIRFMVSSELPSYRADLVRLIHADSNPLGPGLKEEVVSAPINKEYKGRRQKLPRGSYIIVPDDPALQQEDFTLTAWIAPSTPGGSAKLLTAATNRRPLHPPLQGAQGIITKWSEADRVGYGLFLDGDGSLAFWLGGENGKVDRVGTGVPLRAWTPANVWPGGHQMVNTPIWYFVAASFDAGEGKVTLYQEPVPLWPVDYTRSVVEKPVTVRSAGKSEAPLLIAAYWESHDTNQPQISGQFNGKIEAPKMFDRALSGRQIEELKNGGSPEDPLAAWDFSRDIGSRTVSDIGEHELHGQTMQMPTRGMTGHNWREQTTGFPQSPTEYGAIHFHDDDLNDAGWQVDFEYTVPETLKSGVYAARLRAGNSEDHVTFFVRPKKGTATAKAAFLIPTFSYLAYSNSRRGAPQLLSTYNYHSDGSGVAYSSRLLPILTIRPKIELLSTRTGLLNPTGSGGFLGDMMLIDWLEARGLDYDIITDEDLHWEGESLLSPYNVIMTGAHPEYWTSQMLDSLETYLSGGGRLMYLGGNGFYWVTSMDPEGKHTVEIRRRDGTNTWEAAPGEYHHSTTGEFGGLWRFRGRPPQKLVGVGFTAQASALGRPYARQPASFDPRASWIFEGIGPDELIGDFPCLVNSYGAAGFEIDRYDHVLGTPAHALLLATATGFSDGFQHVIEETLQSDSKQGGTVNPWVKADMTYFETGNGGAVWTSASISWMGSLSYNDYKNNVSRLTENVLRRFSADEPLLVTQ